MSDDNSLRGSDQGRQGTATVEIEFDAPIKSNVGGVGLGTANQDLTEYGWLCLASGMAIGGVAGVTIGVWIGVLLA